MAKCKYENQDIRQDSQLIVILFFIHSSALYKSNFIKAITDIKQTLYSEDAGGRPESEKTVVLFLTQGKHENHSLVESVQKLHADPQ